MIRERFREFAIGGDERHPGIQRKGDVLAVFTTTAFANTAGEVAWVIPEPQCRLTGSFR